MTPDEIEYAVKLGQYKIVAPKGRVPTDVALVGLRDRRFPLGYMPWGDYCGHAYHVETDADGKEKRPERRDVRMVPTHFSINPEQPDTLELWPTPPSQLRFVVTLEPKMIHASAKG
jgi:hypothetical protein